MTGYAATSASEREFSFGALYLFSLILDHELGLPLGTTVNEALKGQTSGSAATEPGGAPAPRAARAEPSGPSGVRQRT